MVKVASMGWSSWLVQSESKGVFWRLPGNPQRGQRTEVVGPAMPRFPATSYG